MRFRAASLPGVFVIEPEPVVDERGHFARTFCASEFGERGLVTGFVQWSTSYNRHRATLRGLHYQAAPHEETKLVSCAKGAIWDVVADLRPDSPTFGRWFGERLDDRNGWAFYVPAGLAHGFVTLSDDATVHYAISSSYQPAAARGIRWDDPRLDISWPLDPTVISERDRSLPLFNDTGAT
jgi:dTDP-4-dehydrorhamnose 3,5-epimerase